VSFTASCIRSLGTLPRLYLVHSLRIRIIREATSCNQQKVSLLALTSILAPTNPVDTANSHPLSALDGDILMTIGPALPRNPSALQKLLHNLPPELLSQILSDCDPGHALAICVGLDESYWRQVIRDDTARQRLTVGIQANQLLQDQPYEESSEAIR
jgi:hypothetical protein